METPEASKKLPLEDLPKEEVIKKYRGLVNILQKAKQSKDSLAEENHDLKHQIQELKNSSNAFNPATEELINNLTQQKLHIVTSLDELKHQKEVLQKKLEDCELNLDGAKTKITELDTENQGCKRQLKRLTDENEQLLSDLDDLEKQSNELKRVGLQQQQQLLALEQANDSKKEFIYDEVSKKNEELLKTNEELVQKNKELTENHNELVKKVETLQVNCKNAEDLTGSLKITIAEKNKQNEVHLNTTDDLNIELHKNKALVEKLQQDIVNMSNKLSDNQIVSSGVACDLQNSNEKLKEKIKLFHSKLVKFACDVKHLKEQKAEILNCFKGYYQQVKFWETQLGDYTTRIISQFKKYEEENARFSIENRSLKETIVQLEGKINELQVNQNDAVNILEQESLIKEIDDLRKQNVSLLEVENELKILKDQQETETQNLQKQIELLQEQHENVLSEKNALLNQLQSYETQSDDHNGLKLKLEEEIETRERKIKELLIENEELNHKINESEKNCSSESQKVVNLKEQISSLEKEVRSLKTTETKLAEETANEITKLVQENKSLNEMLQSLSLASSEKTSTTSQTDNNQEDQVSILKRENAELLTEMNEMNQALKERGETISKQQEYCEELLRNAKVFETQSNKNLELVREKGEIIKTLEENIALLRNDSQNQSVIRLNGLQKELEQKNQDLKTLQDELSAYKERLNTSQQSLDTSHDAGYAESETMSTSTISRTEELSRLKDLEGSWEERYGKLRNLALKLKGKIRELTSELTREQNEKGELQQKLSSSLKTVQSLQSQCDNLQDELDSKKKELKEYVKKLDSVALDISKNKKQLADNDELIVKLKSDIDVLSKEKSNVENWKKQVSSKVQNLKKELEANAVLKKDFDNQISKLNAQLEATDKSLKEEIEKHNTTKSSLQESNNECKKQSVLNLEMQDYERSLKDLTHKLKKKQDAITKLENQIDAQKTTASALKEQNRLLEERILNSDTELNNASAEIKACKKSISEFENLISQKDEKLQDLIRTLEHCRADNEDLSTQASKLVSENKKTFDQIKSERDYLRGQNLGLEQTLQETRENLRLREEELNAIRTEYQGYKVRAQSVLRQNQTRDVGLEEKLSEESASLRAQVGILTSEIQELKSCLEKVKEENAKLESARAEIEKKCNHLENSMDQQKDEHKTLANKYENAVTEHAEAIRNLKVHAETLGQCYRQQLSEQEVRHNREIIELQSKIDKVAPVPEVPTLVPPSVPREQGEGSESTESSTVNTRPVPLDRLLSSESDQDVGFMKKQISENETKVAHLTALLADTEQDLAKHVQMNKLLKEEIRRQQRSVEREQHAENLEYLKNVIFKFATLGSGDERSRLVPVLNTILKFSPEEINKLNTVARGDNGGRGWSNYLPIWTSPGRPQ